MIKDSEIILALADSNMSISEASKKVFLHRNTVVYRMEKIYMDTGLNPRNFHDLTKLVHLVKEEKEKDEKLQGNA